MRDGVKKILFFHNPFFFGIIFGSSDELYKASQGWITAGCKTFVLILYLCNMLWKKSARFVHCNGETSLAKLSRFGLGMYVWKTCYMWQWLGVEFTKWHDPKKITKLQFILRVKFILISDGSSVGITWVKQETFPILFIGPFQIPVCLV